MGLLVCQCGARIELDDECDGQPVECAVCGRVCTPPPPPPHTEVTCDTVPGMDPDTTNAGWYFAAGILVLNAVTGVLEMVIARQSIAGPISARTSAFDIGVVVALILLIVLFAGLINRRRWAKLMIIAISFTGVVLALFLLPRWAVNLFGGRWITGLAMMTQPAAWILLLHERGTWSKVCLGVLLYAAGLSGSVYMQMNAPLE